MQVTIVYKLLAVNGRIKPKEIEGKHNFTFHCTIPENKQTWGFNF